MIALPRTRRRMPTQAVELLSLTERSRYLSGLRVGLAGVVISTTFVSDDVSGAEISVAVVLYLALSALTAVIVGRGGRAAGATLNGSLLVDGIFLAQPVEVRPERVRAKQLGVSRVEILKRKRIGLVARGN